MNFFTRTIVISELAPLLLCDRYRPGVYNDAGVEGTVLGIFKLEYQHRNVRTFDPFVLMNVFFLREGWDEGWSIVKDQLEQFINSNGPTQGMSLSLQTIQDRTVAFDLLAADPMFVRVQLRLEIVRIVEEA
jgi:hypothetical protein